METKQTKPIELSIVVLCYQAGQSTKEFVNNTIKELADKQISNYELILVANYHPEKEDPTPMIAKRLAKENPKIKCVAKAKQGMMGWDMRSGLQAAQGKFVAVIDGDGQMPINDLVRVYEEIKTQDCDLVKTYRTKRGDGVKRKIISFFYNLLFRILFPGIKSQDVNSKPKIFKRSSLQKLKLRSDDWFIDAEIMIEGHKNNFKIKEIPTNFLKLEDRPSFINTKAILEFLKNFIKYRFLK